MTAVVLAFRAPFTEEERLYQAYLASRQTFNRSPSIENMRACVGAYDAWWAVFCATEKAR